MRSSQRLTHWAFVHKWTSLICTLFILVVCVTGLPLVFSEEIEHWLEPHSYAAAPEDTPNVSLDSIVAAARQTYAGEIVSSIFIDDDEPQIYLWMASSFEALNADEKSEHYIRFDARSGAMLERSKAHETRRLKFMDLMLRLHTDLLAGLPGELLLAAMAVLFVAAIISGVVLYAPFMRRMAFGEVRFWKTSRVKWLDMHNLLGVTMLAWTLVIGITGALNELSTPLFMLWRHTEVEAMLAPWRGVAPPSQSQLASVQKAIDVTKAALPDMTVSSVTFPGSEFGSPHHYVVWTKGQSPLTSRLFTAVLVDAQTDAITAVARMPWYLSALELSRPLHFGDYGGEPLKMVWAAFDLVTIAVLGSGLYLWFPRRRPRAATSAAAASPSVRVGQAAE